MSTQDVVVTAFPFTGAGTEGMELRDYFAAKAMQAFCSDPDWRQDMLPDETARASYHMADSMLKARNG